MSVTGSVLVLGQGPRAFLSVIRSLGRMGLDVHVGMCPPGDIALRSRYVAAYHGIPGYSSDSSEWLEAVMRLAREHRYDLIVPCDDRSLIPLQLHRDQLSQFSRLCTLGSRAFEVAFDKIASTHLARELGLPTAREIVVAADTSVESILGDLSLPVVVKPPSSFVAEDLSTRRSVRRACSRDELAAILEGCSGWAALQIQENFIGTGVGVEVLADGGRVLVAFQHVRVHEPLSGGGSSYRRSARLSPDLLAATTRLMEALDYTGVAMVEFKVDLDTGKWVFIEINGRFWGSLPLALAAGADFPRYLYELMVHGRRRFRRRYAVGIHCRNLSKDRYWMQGNLTADRSDPLLATRPLWKVAMEVLNLAMLRERSDTLTMDDIGPGLAEIAEMARAVCHKLASIVRRRITAIPLVRKLLVWRMLRAVRRARTILFVCKGNICRSPFAERCAREHLGARATILSSGYFPRAGRGSPVAALEAAREFAVDLTTHRSSRLSAAAIRQADVVFVFDEHNRTKVLKAYPFDRSKVFGLGILLEAGETMIADPWGSDVAVFRKTYAQIAEAIDRLSSALSG